MSGGSSKTMGAFARIESAFEPLTQRECECLIELASGERPQRIASTLGIAPITVEFHIRNARRKLGAKTREHAIAIALTNNLLAS